MLGYISVYSMSSHCNMLYSIYTHMAVSTSLVITGYIQCPPTVTGSILYILLWLFQHVWLYLGIFYILPLYMLNSIYTPMAVSTCLVISRYIQCPPTVHALFYIYSYGGFNMCGYNWVYSMSSHGVTCCILYKLLWLFQHVWLYQGIVNVLPL